MLGWLRKAYEACLTPLLWGLTGIMALMLPVYSAFFSVYAHAKPAENLAAAPAAAISNSGLAATDLLQAVGGFYQTVIMVLIALLAIVASLVYLSIRAASRSQIETQFEKDLGSEWLKHRINKQIDDAVRDQVSDLAREIEVLQKRVISLSRTIGDEGEGAGGTIEVGSGDG